MGASTNIVLAATAVSFGNEWYQTSTPNWRIPVAGLGVSIVLDGIEKFSRQGAIGLATIMMITILITPFNGKSPAQTLADSPISKPSTGKASTAAGAAPIATATTAPGTATVPGVTIVENLGVR